MGLTADDIVEEARRIMAAASAEQVPLRLIGGVAIRLHADSLPAALQRPYQDIDLVTTGKGGRSAVKLLTDLGYTPNDRFNAMHAGRRAVVYDVERERQIDVFVGEFQMCHRVDIAGRLDVDTPTVPLAELLLTKLQIVQLNRKDIVDIAAILYDHEVGDGDGDMVNGAVIARALSGDWGLWRTTRGTIETAHGHLGDLALAPADERRVRDRLDRLWEMADRAPKSLRWRSRARIGERTRWYEEPEEVAHDRTGERL
jgi:hypothetical protein